MTLRLLFYWTKRLSQKGLRRLLNHIRYRFGMKGKQGYAIQGELAKRLNKEGRYLELSEISDLAIQSTADNDDIFFDYLLDQNKALTVRMYRATDKQFMIIEILPDTETNGVFIKQTREQGLLNELNSTLSANNLESKGHRWFESQDYRYTPW